MLRDKEYSVSDYACIIDHVCIEILEQKCVVPST